MTQLTTLRNHRGSAMVYTLAMIPVMILSLLYVYNSYQLSNEKVRLQNTADAVAYSVGVIAAKDLNFKAYTNRAMVANHVAAAQIVSLPSWAHWLDMMFEDIASLTQWLPIGGEVTNAASNRMDISAQAMGLASATDINQAELTNQAYGNAQQIWHGAAHVLAADTLVAVAQANDPHVDAAMSVTNEVFTRRFNTAHNAFSSRYSANSTETVEGNNVYRMDELRGYSGLLSYDDLSDRGPLEEVPGIVIAVSKPNGPDSIKTLGAMETVSAGSRVAIEEYGSLHNDRMVASAKVELYFSRPTTLPGWARGRSSGGSGAAGTGYGNLYNPFWQPRLSNLTGADAALINQPTMEF